MNQEGFEAKNFSTLEKLNSPLPLAILKMYPELRLYNGFGINLFRLEHDQRDGTFRVFPKRLSKKYNSLDFFQIDLLEVPDITKKNRTEEKKQSHCLLIRSLIKLLNAHKRRFVVGEAPKWGVCHQNYICRGCLKIFRYKIAFQNHLTSCVVKGDVASNRRLNKNQYVHKTHFKDRFNNTRRRVKTFTKGELFKRLKPPLFAVLDFESTNERIQDPSAANCSNAVFRQNVLAYGYTHISTYEHIPLPRELEQIRIQFLDRENTAETHFFLKLLTSLKKDLFLVHQHFKKIFALDPGLPRFKDRCFQDRLEYFLKVNF